MGTQETLVMDDNDLSSDKMFQGRNREGKIETFLYLSGELPGRPSRCFFFGGL